MEQIEGCTAISCDYYSLTEEQEKGNFAPYILRKTFREIGRILEMSEKGGEYIL